jgi:NADH-ubiquinone oxidoreductase MWFE subunit
MAWWEAMVPMGIISVTFGLMGGIIYGLDIFESGKPKPMRIDIFDHYCIARDKRIDKMAHETD